MISEAVRIQSLYNEAIKAVASSELTPEFAIENNNGYIEVFFTDNDNYSAVVRYENEIPRPDFKGEQITLRYAYDNGDIKAQKVSVINWE